ncbi:PQQ-dependent sugar dehydrogenase [Piscinibacter gummiphilus]|uniref:PQQ-dependent sugar dehydrogenase n=1 Tax=Piscinibacter gummiphilus TaxID=946333 RepID=A0ABZ0CZX9_9BURK|nr:PQQ-dependent sugar dehydrogenase [Piscinibacter gummiphilus]WOB08741.1 PQQ-dependent sugar dehydrogenase [Piscinibacter gummiphilus]
MKTLPARTLLAGAILLVSASTWAQAGPSPGCQPLETREANATSQQPAFAGQTRACAAPRSAPVTVTVLATGLVKPWAVEPLPDGHLLVTEKPGRMRIVSPSGQLGAPLAGLPAVDARGQGGLLDVALSPGFATDRTVYWSYSEPRQGGNGTSVAKGVLSADRTKLEQVRVILRTSPTYDGDKHFGSRLAFGPDGMLYVTMGERSDRATRPQAQAMNSHLGKILRLQPDGSVPPDNPFVGRAGALPEIWTVGHRNVQAAAFDPQGTLWVVEMGTRGGDELNLVEKGRNYGWPLIAYGEEYSGQPIGPGATAREGLVQPAYYWDPVIAPSGAQWYTGDAFPAWKGNLFIGGLKDRKLVRLVLDGHRVVGEEWLLAERGKRIRDVRQDAAGALFVVTDENEGELWKITPGP